MDQSEEPDLEWRDDILYRTPPRQRVREADAYAIEAVSIDDESVSLVAVYASSDEAHAALSGIEDDLMDLTRSEFEARYLEAPTE